jgi:hypothetical protein
LALRRRLISTAIEPGLLGNSSTVEHRIPVQAADLPDRVFQSETFLTREMPPNPAPLKNWH